MPSNQFVYGATTIQMPMAPLRTGSSDAHELIQAIGYDSDGDQYVYDKGGIVRVRHKLSYTDITTTLLASIKAFFATTSRGSYHAITWYDHDEVSHTVRQAGAIDAVEVGSGRYRVDLVLDEEVAWAAAALPGDVSSKSCAPVWVLRMTINSVVYYLSDGTYTITPWGVTTKPWVRAWGSVRTGISGALAEYQVSDFDVSLLSDPAASPNMETLATTYPLETAAADLYLWMRGSVEAPSLMFRGYVDDVDIPDETAVNLVIRDETSRLQAYIGTKLDATTYPNADPDDIGKVFPIIYGTVTKLPALAVDAGHMTTLVAAIDGDDTSLVFSEITGFEVGTKFWIDQEKMTITGISGTTVTVTRAVDSTTAQNHGEAATIWEDKSAFAYMVADHPVDAIIQVFGKVGDGVLDITSVCTRYIGQAGSVLTGYTGKAMVTVPGYVTAAQAVSLGFLDAGSVVGSISLQSLIALLDPGHYHNTAASTVQNTTTSLPLSTGTSGTVVYPWNGYSGDGFYMTLNFSSDISGRVQVSYSITVKKKSDGLGDQLWIRVNGTLYWWQDAYFDALAVNSSVTLTFTVTNSTDCNANSAIVYFQWPNTHFEITAASRSIQTSTNASSAEETGQTISAGDIEISGNSVANTLVGDAVLVNVTRSITPINVFSDILSRAGSSAVAMLSGSLPSSYGVNGAIVEYGRAIEWLNTIAHQLRSWFVMERGIASLIVRPSTLTSIRTISACRVTDDGIKIHRRRKADIDDVLNVINLLYTRDWTQSRSDTAYQASAADSDSTSITNYGEHEQPDLFQCDFITSDTMAADVLDFYLDNYSGRPWLHEFETYLDYSDVRFGQVVTLGFAGSAVGIVIEAGPSPGSGNDIDTMKFTVMV